MSCAILADGSTNSERGNLSRCEVVIKGRLPLQECQCQVINGTRVSVLIGIDNLTHIGIA